MGKMTVVLVRQNGLGSVGLGDGGFGHEMFDKFLHTLESLTEKPQAICFYTEGVRLACEGSPVLFSLRLLEKMGIRMVVCASCLEYYGLRERVAVGQAGGMKEIVELLTEADSVITV